MYNTTGEGGTNNTLTLGPWAKQRNIENIRLTQPCAWKKQDIHTTLCASIKLWYSSSNPLTPSQIICGWGWNYSKYTLFLAFHIAQAVIAYVSSSCLLSLVCICLKRRKKSLSPLLHFWNFPLINAQTFLTKGRVHNIWMVVLGYCLHSSQVDSTRTHLRCRLSRVGKQLEHARHINIRIFGGTLRDQISFHVHAWSRAAECSTLGWFFKWTTTL